MICQLKRAINRDMHIKPFLEFVHLCLEESDNFLARLLSVENLDPMYCSGGNLYHTLK
jgi:hypothetical protein